jgi:phosphohistidine phosphatase
MDLILWRHAEAEEGGPDLARALTGKGRKQAARVAEWLVQRLPAKFSLLASPAKRAQQTAQALEAKIKTVERLAPGASVSDVLQAAGWPGGDGVVLVVGHQPDLGAVVAHLLAGAKDSWSIKKGGLWWLRNRSRDEGEQTVVRAVVSPELL